MQNMYNNYNYTNYNQQPNIQQNMTELSKEENSILRKGLINEFVLDLSPYETIRAACPHRENGKYTLDEIGDGLHKCSLCGEVFELKEATETEVEVACRQVIDILQSTKALNVEMPPNVLKEFMPIIEYLKKVPKLHKIATNTFQKYDSPLHQQGSGYANGFNMFNNIMGGGMGMPMYPQQNMMQGNPNMMAQPMGMYPQQQYNGNPFSNGGDPTMQNPNMMGQQPQQQPQGNPQQGENLDTTKTFSN